MRWWFLITVGILGAIVWWAITEIDSQNDPEDPDQPSTETSGQNPHSDGILATELDYEEEELRSKALEMTGYSYDRDGSSPEEGFSPSGLVQYIYEEATGIRMPLAAHHQSDLGEPVPEEDLRPGDVVFFEGDTLMSGVYTGDGSFVTASQSSGTEELRLDDDSFWARHFEGGIRLTQEEQERLHPGTYEDHDHPAVREAMNYLGTPYEFGGNSLEAFDCSFFVQEVFAQHHDTALPRVTLDQVKEGSSIDREETRPGDVMYFSDVEVDDDEREEGDVTHAGIYVGGGFMIHASRSENQVQISYLHDYWEDAYTDTRRFDDMTRVQDAPAASAALDYLHEPHEAESDDGMDTAELVKSAWYDAYDTETPATAEALKEVSTPIDPADRQPDDLLFFEGDTGLLAGIYTGNDQIITVTVSSGTAVRHLENSDFYEERLTAAGRLE
ncbi:NlpC/P60 family protein [Alkalicoccus chagannorensis]|uniref:NlpC/P60 family protein n=1 Tax=Alkalicoccus chagannorensis TaxID=427072 RepID=UPI0004068F2C|nr:NlpC/P60 family protein [Alkalicoccus chagannorensis]